MKKTILTISLILFCFEFLKAQELTIDDLQKCVIAGSIGRIDSLLRLKGYKLTGLPEEGDKDTSYKFEKSTEIGNIDILSVYKNTDEAGTRIAYVICDNETKFYRLKKECEKLREIKKIDEFSKPGAVSQGDTVIDFLYILLK